MPDSGQLLKFDDIRKGVALHRGYGLSIDDWEDEQKALIELCLVRGCNKFYTGASYDWSFLKPLATLRILDGTTELILPPEFAFLTGDIYFDSDTGGPALQVENETRVFRRRQESTTTTGRPQFACILAREPGATHGPRQVLSFWPEADDDYTITLRYSILPEALSTSQPYPYGGQAHSNTILEACLSASEQLDGELGIHTQLYEQALAASKEYDRKVKSQTVAKETQRTRPYRYSNAVTLSDDFYID